jgi:hypothetical protein
MIKKLGKKLVFPPATPILPTPDTTPHRVTQTITQTTRLREQQKTATICQ